MLPVTDRRAMGARGRPDSGYATGPDVTGSGGGEQRGGRRDTGRYPDPDGNAEGRHHQGAQRRGPGLSDGAGPVARGRAARRAGAAVADGSFITATVKKDTDD
jgi:hypothetical protein